METNYDVSLEIENKEGKVVVNGYNNFAIIQQVNKGHLTSYETLSKPRIIKDISQVEISQQQINRIIEEIFRCSICLQIFNDPVSNKDCLHKYCKKCIEDYLRRSKRECVICRKNIETKRLMREDNKIQHIINCIIPNLNEYITKEDEETKVLVKNICNEEIEKRKNIVDTLKELKKKEKYGNANVNRSKYKSLTTTPRTMLNSLALKLSSNRDTTTQQSNEGIIDHSETFLQRKREHNSLNSLIERRDKIMEIDMFKNTKSIPIKLNTEDYLLKSEFLYAEFFLPEDVTFQFIAQYLCYKQNWDIKAIDSINFYAKYLNNHKFQISKEFYLRELVVKRESLRMNNNMYEVFFHKSKEEPNDNINGNNNNNNNNNNVNSNNNKDNNNNNNNENIEPKDTMNNIIA